MNVPLPLARIVGPDYPVVVILLDVIVEKMFLRGSRSDLFNTASAMLSIVLLGMSAEAGQLRERSPVIDNTL